MAKDYLNRQEREVMAVVLLLHANLEELLENSGKHMSKLERTACKTAMTWMIKFVGQCGGRVGKAEFKKVTDIVLDQKLTFKDRTPQVLSDNRNILEVDADSFADVAEGIIDAHCRGCRKDAQQIEHCKIRELMTLADVPEVEEGDYDKCQYRMRR